MSNAYAEKMNTTGLALLQFEAACYLRYIMLVIELYRQDKPPLKYGDAVGFDSFVALSAQLDFSVFLYEALKLFERIVPEKVEDIGTPQFQKNLKVVRNNIHTYYKSGGYSKKAEEIISSKLKEYKMEKRDILYPLRNDISLVFQIEDKERRLIGSDQFAFHCIFESDEKTWRGAQYKEYATNLSAAIKGIASSFDDSVYQLAELKAAHDIPPIELFDFKSADLFDIAGIGDTVAFRLMLSLSQISYGILLDNHLIDKNIFSQSELWTLFMTKLLAIKYDEAFNNVQSILNHADSNERKTLQGILEKTHVYIDKLQARAFAQRLRNTIHYNNISIDVSLCSDGTTSSWIKAIYLTNSGTTNMAEFREKKAIMMKEMSLLQNAIQACFSLNKTYN